MANVIGQGVTLEGFYNEGWQFTFNITGTVNKATDIGKVVSQDTTAANSAKLALDGEVLLGVLSSYEQRIQEGINVGTVGMKDFVAVPYTGTLAVGDSIVGSATPGVAKKATAQNNTRVFQIKSDGTAVVGFL